MKSKSLIERQIRKKNNPILVETIISAKKNKNWLVVASLLSRSKRKRMHFNLDEINKESKDGEKVLIPGKVLSQGEVDKKIKIVALNFSEKAKEKLLKSSCEALNILDEIKLNPEFKNIKILKK